MCLLQLSDSIDAKRSNTGNTIPRTFTIQPNIVNIAYWWNIRVNPRPQCFGRNPSAISSRSQKCLRALSQVNNSYSYVERQLDCHYKLRKRHCSDSRSRSRRPNRGEDTGRHLFPFHDIERNSTKSDRFLVRKSKRWYIDRRICKSEQQRTLHRSV